MAELSDLDCQIVRVGLMPDLNSYTRADAVHDHFGWDLPTFWTRVAALVGDPELWQVIPGELATLRQQMPRHYTVDRTGWDPQ